MDINATNHEGRTALHACYANAAHAEMLLAAGADPAVKEKKHPHTAFLHAVYNGWVRGLRGSFVCELWNGPRPTSMSSWDSID